MDKVFYRQDAKEKEKKPFLAYLASWRFNLY